VLHNVMHHLRRPFATGAIAVESRQGPAGGVDETAGVRREGCGHLIAPRAQLSPHPATREITHRQPSRTTQA
jgi:hypothetical protein